MSTGRRRFSMKHPVVVVDVGCGCRRQKLSALLSSLRPKPRSPKTPHSLSSTSLWPSNATSISTSTSTMMNSSSYSPSSHGEAINASPPPPRKEEEKCRRRRRRMKKPASASASAESVAVVKDSSEPYADFRESMVQMIVENDLYAWDDLNDLLHRFLSLNSPRHHHLILRAFADLWTGVFSPPSPCSYY